MPNTVPIQLDLAAPDPDAGGEIARIIDGRLRAQGRALADPPPPLHQLWPAEFFGLHKVRLFAEADAERRERILDGCAKTLLNEAYFIEKSGMAYCAKMILLACSPQVEQVYSLIAADEATHLQWIRPYVAEEQRQRPEGEFLRFLGGLIERCDQNTLAYLVQVILEGWGLHHYRNLGKACRYAPLKNVFMAIHRDEALHHHTGEVVFQPSQTTGEQAALVADALRTYTELVRVGPQAVAGVLDREFGGLGKARLAQVFGELESERTSAEKLGILRSLMAGPGRERYLAALDEAGAFTPYAPSACAAIHG
ncbi:MAG: ferritin-like domain-containing protein [Verrucomicrobiales bacterium]